MPLNFGQTVKTEAIEHLKNIVLGTVHYLLGVQNQCSVGKTQEKCSCPINKNFQKSWCPVSGRKEKSMSHIITLYSHCAGGTICNDGHCHLQLGV